MPIPTSAYAAHCVSLTAHHRPVGRYVHCRDCQRQRGAPW